MSNEDLAIAVYEGMEIIFDNGGDPWLTQGQIAELLGISKQAVSDMLNVAIKGKEIPPESVVNLRLTASDGKTYNVKHYDFDAVLIVGYRSKENSERTKAFRKWVSGIVKSHLRSVMQRNENLSAALSNEQREKRQLEWRLEEYGLEQERKNRDNLDLYDYNEM